MDNLIKKYLFIGALKIKAQDLNIIINKYNLYAESSIKNFADAKVFYGLYSLRSKTLLKNDVFPIGKRFRIFNNKIKSFTSNQIREVEVGKFPTSIYFSAYDKVYNEPLYNGLIDQQITFKHLSAKDPIEVRVQISLAENLFKKAIEINDYFINFVKDYNFYQSMLIEDSNQRLPEIYYLSGIVNSPYYSKEEQNKAYKLLDSETFFKTVPHIGKKNYLSKEFLKNNSKLHEHISLLETEEFDGGIIINSDSAEEKIKFEEILKVCALNL
jgi:hypothetical protein